jgi:endonuclease YncB( thermonuclease family)
MIIEKKVTKIVDGDTINVEPFDDGENSVRLLGIDTPETNYRGRSQGKHADDATNFLKDLISVGDILRIETDEEERDRYGRVLAHAFKADENINVKLVAEGIAAPYQIFPNLKYLGEIQQATVSARQGRKGIYNPDDPLEELPFEFRMRVDGRSPHKYVGNFTTKLYYNPIEYTEVALENRVFFFKEHEAIDAGYTLRKKPVSMSNIVDKAYEGLIFEELLKAPVSALKGVSKNDEELLDQAFGIKTIDDMAGNKYFAWAKAIKSLSE